MVVAEENRVSRVRHVAGDSWRYLGDVDGRLDWMAVDIDRASKITFFFEFKITYIICLRTNNIFSLMKYLVTSFLCSCIFDSECLNPVVTTDAI